MFPERTLQRQREPVISFSQPWPIFLFTGRLLQTENQTIWSKTNKSYKIFPCVTSYVCVRSANK